MAQLKSSVVQGSLRVTDTTYTTDLILSGSQDARHALIAPTSDGAPTWRALTKADISDFPTNLNQFTNGPGYVTSSGVTSITIKTTSPLSGGSNTATTSTGTYTLSLGTVGVTNGGTGATSAAAARTNLGTPTGNARIFYGTCATAAETTTKEVTCTAYDALQNGDIIYVTFSYTNSGAVASLQLDVNNKGAKPIKYLGNATQANLPAVGYIVANIPYRFVYNGTNWIMDLYYNTNDDYRCRQKLLGDTDNTDRALLLSDPAYTTADNNTLYVTRRSSKFHANINTGIITAPGFNGDLTGDVTGNVSGTAANVTGTVAIAHGGTGKTSALAAATNLGAPYLLLRGTAMAEASNLDEDYKAMGTYYSSSGTISGSLTGTVPITGSGFKMITAVGYRAATLRQFLGGASNELLYRSTQNTGTDWTKWHKFVFLPSGDDEKTFEDIGSTTRPTYVSADGIVTLCSTYAGGTRVVLNGSSKSGATATFYAPTAVGSDGQVLTSNGSGAPSWTTLEANAAVKTFAITWASGTSYAYSNSWITANAAVVATDLQTKTLPGIVTWTVAAGKITFSCATAPSNLSFNIMMIKEV